MALPRCKGLSKNSRSQVSPAQTARQKVFQEQSVPLHGQQPAGQVSLAHKAPLPRLTRRKCIEALRKRTCTDDLGKTKCMELQLTASISEEAVRQSTFSSPDSVSNMLYLIYPSSFKSYLCLETIPVKFISFTNICY